MDANELREYIRLIRYLPSCFDISLFTNFMKYLICSDFASLSQPYTFKLKHPILKRILRGIVSTLMLKYINVSFRQEDGHLIINLSLIHI